jgi:hypothetical protein
MNARKLAKRGQITLATIGLLWLVTCGSAYFRSRELSPEELNQKNQEDQKVKDQRLFQPDKNYNR